MVDPFALRPSDLTLGELAAIEEITDWSSSQIVAAFDGSGVESAQFVLALTFVANQRVDPSYTLDAARAVKWSDLTEVMVGDGGTS